MSALENTISGSAGEFDDLIFDWLWKIDASGMFTYSNGKLERQFGQPSATQTQQTLTDMISTFTDASNPKNRQQLIQLAKLMRERQDVMELAFSIALEYGQTLKLILSAKVLRNASGRFTGYRGAGRMEIQEFMHTEGSMQNKTLLMAIEHSPNGVLVTDQNGVIIYANPGFSKISGYEQKEVYGKTPKILNAGVNSPEFYQNFWGTLKKGQSWVGTIRNRRKNGEIFWCRESVSPVVRKDGVISNFIAIQQDVTSEVDAQKALKDSEARFKGYAEAASDWYWEMDENLRFTYVSDAACENAGMKRADMLGMSREELVTTDEDREHWSGHLEDLRAHRPFQDFSYSFVRKDGVVRQWQISGKPYFSEEGEFLGYRGVGKDVTEAAILEEQLRHSQKMEVVGHLTGGVAHDFNNLLGIIHGNAELLREALEEESVEGEKLDRIDNILFAAQRGSGITSQLLSFSRKQSLTPKILHLDSELARMRDIIQSSVGSAVKVECISDKHLWPVFVDEDQLFNAILNMSINAKDAMSGAGNLQIAARNVHVLMGDRRTDLKRGEYVVLKVKDTGCGIPRKYIKDVIEPFFSTKERGKGTGLGLSTVYGFVKRSGGSMWIDSKEGEGTEVQLYLPRKLLDT
ncbi:PAS domain S-box protein [Sneathiella sp. P13V-1]|uniref:PAS domain S-box protein n=1 Tax=Sneathiella sp. P13V-1 TaxID=2697366 RepID=UPI00187B3520|nr:PAS domain-containing sensor histidine kinase [Sneathiella sp. P13V-1]MBE7636966.1 PAS domain S-box protein [Sneathiella sp. P13V-1]